MKYFNIKALQVYAVEINRFCGSLDSRWVAFKVNCFPWQLQFPSFTLYAFIEKKNMNKFASIIPTQWEQWKNGNDSKNKHDTVYVDKQKGQHQPIVTVYCGRKIGGKFTSVEMVLDKWHVCKIGQGTFKFAVFDFTFIVAYTMYM